MGDATSKATTEGTREFTLVLHVGIGINGVIVLIWWGGRWGAILVGSVVMTEDGLSRAEVGGDGKWVAIAEDGGGSGRGCPSFGP